MIRYSARHGRRMHKRRRVVLDQAVYALSHRYLEDEDPLQRSWSMLGIRLLGFLF